MGNSKKHNNKFIFCALLLGVAALLAVYFAFARVILSAKNSPRDSSSNTSSRPSEMPFGSNNPYVSDQEETDRFLKDLSVGWVSDHLQRRAIEKSKKGAVTYDFSEIDGKLREYGSESRLNTWFIINIESRLKHGDGREIPTQKGKYIPDGPESYAAYKRFLEALITYVNTKVPGWKPKLWSIDNEHSSLYVPAFCGKKKTINADCSKKAAGAYAQLLERSSKLIKRLDPEAKIVFGGIASSVPLQEYDLYFKQALIALRHKSLDGYFDFFDYHNFGLFEKYRFNMEEKEVTFFRELLRESGFPDKPIIIKAGGTHSGKDEIAKNKRIHRLQTESQQAENLFKRMIYYAAERIAIILQDTGREDGRFDPHGTFSLNGFRYDGVPGRDCNPDKETPCPDPGDGVKKLSYYTYKFLIEKLRGSDFANIRQVAFSHLPNVYVYQFTKGNQPLYVAWWDYFDEKERVGEKRVTLSFAGVSANQARITEAIPRFDADFQTPTKKLNEKDYPRFFSSSVVPLKNGEATFTLGKKPVYIEPLGK